MLRAALLFGSLLLATHAHAAEPLTVHVDAGDACPGDTWFRERLEKRGLRGQIRATLHRSADPEDAPYTGEIEARTDTGDAVHRRLTGALCTTVAEGLLVVAEIHLAGLPDERPPPVPIAPPLPSPTLLPPRPPPPPPWLRFAAGAFATLDTAVTGDPTFGGGLTAWLSLGARPLRGLALSAAYSRADLTKTVPLTHEHLRARLDLIPLDLAIDPKTALALSLFLSAGNLHVAADIDRAAPAGRPLFLTGLGVRARRHLGPLFLEVGVDATLAITRRTFEVTGVPAPLFSLPLFGIATTLAAGVPLGR